MTPRSCAPSSRWAAASAWTWSPKASRPRASCSSCARQAATSRRAGCSAIRAGPRYWARCCRARWSPAARRSPASRTMRPPCVMAAPEPGPHFRRNMNPRRPRRLRRRGLQLLLAAWLALAFWHTLKPLPPGLHVQGAFVVTPAASVQFLADITAQDGAGGMLRQRAIHEATLQLVRGARDFLVLDYFLFNGQGGPNGALEYRDGRAPVAAELIAALRDLKRAQPSLPVLVITDPINDYYRGGVPDELAALREEGIDVVVARLTGLRDSNPLYSATWRLLFGWWLPVSGEGWLPNLLDGAGPDLK